MSEFSKLHDELVEGFIEYQWRLENPFPAPYDRNKAILHYKSDYVFNGKVRQIVAGVMSLVTKHCESVITAKAED